MEEIENKSIIKKTIIVTILEFVLTIIMLFILSLLLSNTSLEEKVITPAIIGISAFSVMIGGFILSKNVKSKGILIGMALGIIYMVILYLFTSILNMNFSLTLKSLAMIGVGVFGGAVGGIVGVNIK